MQLQIGGEMAEQSSKCPKCGHSQTGKAECEACGLIFAKYEKFKQRQQVQKATHPENKKPGKKNPGIFILMVAVVVFTASATYYFARPSDVNQSIARQEFSSQPEEGDVSFLREAVVDPPPDLPVQDKMEFPSGSTLYEARSATVSIKTPWGTGSGFFITESNIVTNRHVVEANQEMVAELRQQVETTSRLIELEKEKLWDYRQRLLKMPEGPGRTQAKILIEKKERDLEEFLPKYEEAERQLEMMAYKLQPSDIEIVLENGEVYYANDISLSEEHDLALLYLYIPDQHFLMPHPSDKPINQGDKVYTIGSPAGLRNTVTSGIFSGFRKRTTDDQVLLQTDAPINPGNSGGPLIDEDGYVLGVNTMILLNTEGIGFAIPIDTVLEEFSISSY